MTDIETIQAELRKFNQERDWDQFHNGKDLAIAISIEAGELLEAFLWKSPEHAKVEKVREELNAQKYPADKARGNAKKYNEF